MSHYQNFIEKAKKTPLGEAAQFSLNILPTEEQKDEWKMAVRYLESEGFAVSLITENFPDGVYIADGLKNGKVQGWKLEEEISKTIKVQNIGWPYVSRMPEGPDLENMGIDVVPFYTMAVLFGTPEGWRKFMYIPAGSFSVTFSETTCIQYGQSAFEGACAMRDEEGNIFGFRLDQNSKRFCKSNDFLGFPKLNAKEIESAIQNVISKNAAYVPQNGKLYIRPSVNGLDKGLGLNPPAHQVVTIEIAAFGDYLPESITVEGLRNISRPETGDNKVAPNYGASYNIKGGVKKRGYNDYLSFTKDGHVEEVSTCAVGFITEKEEFVFPPVIGEIDEEKRNILPSITRKSVIEILKAQGKNVIIRDVHYTDIPKMKAMFTMGNAVGILRVTKICIKENFEDSGQIVKFDESMLEVIRGMKANLFAARMGNLEGFEEWVWKCPVK